MLDGLAFDGKSVGPLRSDGRNREGTKTKQTKKEKERFSSWKGRTPWHLGEGRARSESVFFFSSPGSRPLVSTCVFLSPSLGESRFRHPPWKRRREGGPHPSRSSSVFCFIGVFLFVGAFALIGSFGCPPSSLCARSFSFSGFSLSFFFSRFFSLGSRSSTPSSPLWTISHGF